VGAEGNAGSNDAAVVVGALHAEAADGAVSGAGRAPDVARNAVAVLLGAGSTGGAREDTSVRVALDAKALGGDFVTPDAENGGVSFGAGGKGARVNGGGEREEHKSTGDRGKKEGAREGADVGGCKKVPRQCQRHYHDRKAHSAHALQLR